MRVKFSDVLDVRGDRITPHVRVTIGGMTMGPGITVGAGIYFDRVDLGALVYHHLEVEDAGRAVPVVEVH